MTGPGVDPRPGPHRTPVQAPLAYLADALTTTPPDDVIRIVTVPAPVGSPESLLDDRRAELFWTTPGRPVHAGLGVAATVAGSGADRFRELRNAAGRLWARLDPVTHPEAEPLAPRLFGGIAFLPGPLPPEWREFGEARFMLPRLLYTRDGDRAHLSVAIPGRELRESGVDAVVAEAGSLLDRIAVGPPDAVPGTGDAEAAAPRAAGSPAIGRAGGPEGGREDRESWAAAVASIQRRIAAGTAEKIVAARSRAVPVSGAGALSTILRRLGRESATAARFAFRAGDGVFVGATPERLVGRSGREVRTEALAGSVPADRPELEARLLASYKDEVEHAYVVRAIEDALAPLCERLDRPDEPRIQRLRHVVHLQTPFMGRLREPVHVLELVERLHPTPAVGGWPTAPALDWIEGEEPLGRGWYAGPVGWFDEDGDGEFGVALRSGLLRGGRAFLYAGAGIVRHSDAAAEYEETEVKLRTMMEALGVSP